MCALCSQGHSARGHESTDDSFEKATGDSGRDEHTVETEESGEKDTVHNDDGHNESVYEDDASGVSSSRSVNAKKDARRSFEKGNVILLNMVLDIYSAILLPKLFENVGVKGKQMGRMLSLFTIHIIYPHLVFNTRSWSET